MKTRNFPWKRALRAARAKQRSGAPLTDTEARLLYAEASKGIPKDTRHRFGGKARPSMLAQTLVMYDPARGQADGARVDRALAYYGGRRERFIEGAERPHYYDIASSYPASMLQGAPIEVELVPSTDPSAAAAAPPGWQVWDAKIVGPAPAAPPATACVRAYAHDCQCASCLAKPPQNTRGWEP